MPSFKMPQMMLLLCKKHNLLGNPYWKHVQDHALHPSTSTTITDIDNVTELVDGTILNHDSTIIEPMEQTASAAKAASATKCFQRLVGINGKTCCILITDCKSGA